MAPISGSMTHDLSLKGHCHAIWQLYKQLGVHQLNFKTNDLVLLFKTI